ncbi:hypothetical protein TorRG33x02_212120, partial [Trema orientale]
ESSDMNVKNFEQWERSNRMSLMIMKHSIPETIKGAVPKVDNAKAFLDAIAKRFQKNEKAETSTMLNNLLAMRYKGKGNIREYIIEMSNLASKLKALKLELSDDLLVQLVLLSLPPQFSQFKVSYNTQKEKWTLNKLISQCVQEEDTLKRDKTESAHLATTSQDKKIKKLRIKELHLELHILKCNRNKMRIQPVSSARRQDM